MNIKQFHNANQFIIYHDEYISFHSYESLICTYSKNDIKTRLILFDNLWDYSNTTRKHFKLFINELTHFNYVDKKQWLKEIENNSEIKEVTQ